MKKEIEGRRASVETLVIQKFKEVTRKVTVTQMFWELYPDAPEGKESVQKWNDVNRAILKLVNEKLVDAHTPEGKRRTTFQWIGPKEEPAQENDEGSGI